MREEIRRVVADYGQLSVAFDRIDDKSDLFDAGMTSHASVSLMLALEEAFDVEFPEQMVRKDTFRSVAAIEAALCEVQGVVQA